jgi:hypothetical protein
MTASQDFRSPGRRPSSTGAHGASAGFRVPAQSARRAEPISLPSGGRRPLSRLPRGLSLPRFGRFEGGNLFEVRHEQTT